jgi:hypothetical protein
LGLAYDQRISYFADLSLDDESVVMVDEGSDMEWEVKFSRFLLGIVQVATEELYDDFLVV